jgi:hypothetical protein
MALTSVLNYKSFFKHIFWTFFIVLALFVGISAIIQQAQRDINKDNVVYREKVNDFWQKFDAKESFGQLEDDIRLLFFRQGGSIDSVLKAQQRFLTKDYNVSRDLLVYLEAKKSETFLNDLTLYEKEGLEAVARHIEDETKDLDYDSDFVYSNLFLWLFGWPLIIFWGISSFAVFVVIRFVWDWRGNYFSQLDVSYGWDIWHPSKEEWGWRLGTVLVCLPFFVVYGFGVGAVRASAWALPKMFWFLTFSDKSAWALRLKEWRKARKAQREQIKILKKHHKQDESVELYATILKEHRKKRF